MAEVRPKYAENAELLAHGERIAAELEARGYQVNSRIMALNNGVLGLMVRASPNELLALVCVDGPEATADLFEQRIAEAEAEP